MIRTTLLTILAAVVLLLLTIVVGVLVGTAPPQPLPVAAQGGIISNVSVVEPGIGIRSNQTIVVAGNTISEVRPATPEERAGGGGYVMPGLIDMHVHHPGIADSLTAYFNVLYLAHGVTTIRDTGQINEDAAVTYAALEAGEIAGPSVVTCGPILDGPGTVWEQAVLLNENNVAAEVERVAQTGASCIKTYGHLSLPLIRQAQAAAAAHGLKVVSHIPVGVSIDDMPTDDAQHLIGVAAPVGDHPNPMADGWRLFDDARVQHVAEVSLNKNMAHTPTLVFLDSNARRLRHAALAEEFPVHLMPPIFVDLFWLPGQTIRLGGERTEETQQLLEDAFQAGLDATGKLHAAGVKIHAGTDMGNPFSVPGASLVQELRYFQRAGLSIEDALAAATLVPGDFLGGGQARIESGAPADLIQLTDNPLEGLDALDSIEVVVADGRFYPRATLDEAVDRYQSHFNNFVWADLLPVMLAPLMGD